MFGKAQGQKENPGLAKPSQTLRGNEIFDKRMLKLSGHAGTAAKNKPTESNKIKKPNPRKEEQNK